MREPARAELWWAEAPDLKPRPYLILTRDQAIPVLTSLVVAPVTGRVRGIPSEVSLGLEEGLPVECVAAFDAVRTIGKRHLVRRLGALAPGRHHELCDALRAAVDC